MFQRLNIRYKIFFGFLPIVILSMSLGFASFVGVLVISLVSTFAISLSIRDPLLDMDIALSEVAEGNLQQRVEIHSNDEIGDLAQSLNGAIEAIAQTQRLPESILRSMKDSLFVMNNQGLITEVNAAALEVVGYSKEELIGKPVSLILKKINK